MGIERGIEKKQRETDRQVSQVKITIAPQFTTISLLLQWFVIFLGIQRLGCSH